jgi:hypothetical protein
VLFEKVVFVWNKGALQPGDCGKARKSGVEMKTLITVYFVCNKHFFAPNHIKVFIFIKFLIPQKMLKSAHDDFSISAKLCVEYELHSLPKQGFRPILHFILMENS